MARLYPEQLRHVHPIHMIGVCTLVWMLSARSKQRLLTMELAENTNLMSSVHHLLTVAPSSEVLVPRYARVGVCRRRPKNLAYSSWRLGGLPKRSPA